MISQIHRRRAKEAPTRKLPRKQNKQRQKSVQTLA